MKHGLALALALLVLPPTPLSADPSPLVGQPVLALVAEPGLATLLRQASGGRQGIVARRLRDPGPPLAEATDGWVYGWTCVPAGCEREALFIAWNGGMGRLAFMLVDARVPVFAVPPRSGAWASALQGPIEAFRATLGSP